MAKLKIEQLYEIRENLDRVVRKTASDLIRPFHAEISSIQRDAKRLGKDLEKLSAKIARQLTGQVKKGRRRLSKAARRKMALAKKRYWAKKRAKRSKAKKAKPKATTPVHEIPAT